MTMKNTTLATMTLEKLIHIYLSTLQTEGKSPRYLDWLGTRLRYFLDLMHKRHGEEINARDVTLEDGREFMRELMTREERFRGHPMIAAQAGKLSISYVHGMGRALRSFSNWAHEEGYLEEHVMYRLKLPPIPKTQPEPLTEDEIRRVLTMALYHTLERLRNFSMMMLFFDTGLRLSELLNLKLSCIDLPVGEMTVIGKGNKERKVPMGAQAKKALIDYLSKERPKPQNPRDEDRVYLTAESNPVSQVVVHKMFQRVRKAAGVPRLHPHVCRHTFAVRYLVHGGDVFSLQKILGHSSLEMTRRYVNLASDDIKDKHRRFSPMDNLNYRTVTRRGRPKRRIE